MNGYDRVQPVRIFALVSSIRSFDGRGAQRSRMMNRPDVAGEAGRRGVWIQ